MVECKQNFPSTVILFFLRESNLWLTYSNHPPKPIQSATIIRTSLNTPLPFKHGVKTLITAREETTKTTPSKHNPKAFHHVRLDGHELRVYIAPIEVT
uniref:Uncharacterized protein n=1 Tax=Cucumis melo TaxID=3656 RepID=A0A9I9DY02_CUCME